MTRLQFILPMRHALKEPVVIKKCPQTRSRVRSTLMGRQVLADGRGTWFLYDIAFYGTNVFTPTILKDICLLGTITEEGDCRSRGCSSRVAIPIMNVGIMLWLVSSNPPQQVLRAILTTASPKVHAAKALFSWKWACQYPGRRFCRQLWKVVL
eukprot:4327991-Amphidinium_carterae.2